MRNASNSFVFASLAEVFGVGELHVTLRVEIEL
jgi:hypothetical protein